MSAPSGWFWYGSIFIWVFLGVVLQKLNFKRYRSARQAFWNILLLNTLTSIVLYFFARYLDLQLILNWKYVVLVSTLSILEMTIFLLYFTFSSRRKAYQVEEEELVSYHSEADDLRFNITRSLWTMPPSKRSSRPSAAIRSKTSKPGACTTVPISEPVSNSSAIPTRRYSKI